jgi:hypothetical protein
MPGELGVRRTLILGLGTTGLQVAEQVAEHLTWQYGGLEQANWVRLLVLETAQQPSLLGDRLIWVGMENREFVPYRTSPNTAGAEFGFAEWQDGPTISDIPNPADGAGNCRQIGRLCLFHPRTYETVRRRVSVACSELERLTPQQVADSLGEPGLDVRIHEDGVVVYVVGTLCGGTCSGGAADFGYLLRVWTNNAVKCQAIFTIPHPAFQHALGQRLKKNAYYALKELNHFMLRETRWVQRLPGADTPYEHREPPYDITRIMMPGGGTTEDLQRLTSMIAQYLGAAVGPAGFAVAAADVDARTRMGTTDQIGFMRPFFCTMGVAALEYPGEHIQRAATLRLQATAYRRWLEYSTEAPAFAAAVAQLLRGDYERVLSDMHSGSDALQKELVEALRAGPKMPRVADVRTLLGTLEARLAATALPEGGQGPQPLVAYLAHGRQVWLEGIGQRWQQLQDQRLLHAEGGPGFLHGAITTALAELLSWGGRASREARPARQEADSHRELLEDELREVEKAERHWWPFGKQRRIREAWGRTRPVLESYLRELTRAEVLNHLVRERTFEELHSVLRRETALLARRLERINAAFQQEQSGLAERWVLLTRTTPSVNGRVYFDAEPPEPRGTVTREYYELLRSRRWPHEPPEGLDDSQKESAAVTTVLAALRELPHELSVEDTASSFDERPGLRSARESIPGTILAAVEAEARNYFSPLRTIRHIADLAEPSHVSSVVEAAEPRLGVSAAQVSDRLAGVRGSPPFPVVVAMFDLGPNPDQIPPRHAAMRQALLNRVNLPRGLTNSRDPYRLLLIQERLGFTLGQMEGVVKRHPHDNAPLEASEGCTDFRFWYTRRDVDWVDPLVPPTEVESVEEDLLFTLLLGRPRDPGQAWLPSTRGEIESTGWYRVVQGGFYVLYGRGVDAAEEGMFLPASFPAAVQRLIGNRGSLMRRTLAARFQAYRHDRNLEEVVRTVERALSSLAVLGIHDLERAAATQIVRRAYRRELDLRQALFRVVTEDLTERAEFSHLWRAANSEIPGRPGQTYGADGYYCPRCHQGLGNTVQALLESRFLCPQCGGDEPYWP